MTRDKLLQLETLLEEMERSYGEDMSNDRYSALQVTKDTICSLILNQMYINR